MRVTFIVLLTCALLPVAAEQAPDLPDLGNTSLSIPWADFRELLDRIEPEKPKEEEVVKPPFDSIVTSVDYDAEAVDSKSVRVDAQLQVQSLNPKVWAKVPVVGAGVAPTDVTLNGNPTSLAPDGEGWHAVLIEKPGLYTLDLTFFVPCKSENGRASFQFLTPKSPITRMKLTLPARDAMVQAPAAAHVAVERGEKALTADLAFMSTKEVAVSWTLKAIVEKKADEKKKAPPEEEARISCFASTLATIGERHLSCESLLRFDVLRGKTDTFALRLPAGVNVLNVTGEGSGWTRTDEPNGQRISVKVNHAVVDHYDVQIQYETPFAEEMAVLTVPELTVADMVRQTGFIGIAARGNVEVEPGPEIDGATRVDVSELPQGIRALSASPLLLAYKYSDNRYTVPVDVRRLEDQPVRQATIDRARLVTMITDENEAITRALYEVRNNTKQFLRVNVGKDADVWSAAVGGEVRKPAREAETDAVLIPLLKSAQTGKTLGTFQVELLYKQTLPKRKPFAGTRDLTAPATDIPVNRVQWEVRLPARECMTWAKGDLRSSGFLALPTGQPNAMRPMVRDITGGRTETVYRLREGIERFFIKDINNPAASAGRGPHGRYEGDPVKATPGESGVSVAGILPVRVDMPLEGRPYHFRRLVVAEGQPLALRLYTYDGRLLTAGRILIYVGLALIAFRIGRRLKWGEALTSYIRPAVFTIVLWVIAHYAGLTWMGALVVVPCLSALGCLLANRKKHVVEPTPEPTHVSD